MKTPYIALRLAHRLKTLREKNGWTQEEAAEKVGMDIRYYQRLESKKPFAIRIDTLDRLAKVFRVKPSKLIDS